jgi:anaerobic dimethyl sulfoxide reductase subunit B (iron-sulfur subunit)
MSDEQYGFIFVSENCIQCHGCEVACKSWRNVELGVKYRRVENIWKGVYPDVKCFSVSLSCMHCTEPACMAACPQEAISKRAEDGIVLVDAEKCVGCRTCSKACPFDVPQFGESTKMRKCDMCMGEKTPGREDPPCVLTCPTGALTLIKMTPAKKKETESLMKTLLDAAGKKF